MDQLASFVRAISMTPLAALERQARSGSSSEGRNYLPFLLLITRTYTTQQASKAPTYSFYFRFSSTPPPCFLNFGISTPQKHLGACEFHFIAVPLIRSPGQPCWLLVLSSLSAGFQGPKAHPGLHANEQALTTNEMKDKWDFNAARNQEK